MLSSISVISAWIASPKRFDLVFSNLAMQWCDDVGSVLSEFRRVLKPGGLLVFTTFGPDTLKELRASWQSVDDAVHVNAFIDIHKNTATIGTASAAQVQEPIHKKSLGHSKNYLFCLEKFTVAFQHEQDV